MVEHRHTIITNNVTSQDYWTIAPTECWYSTAIYIVLPHICRAKLTVWLDTQFGRRIELHKGSQFRCNVQFAYLKLLHTSILHGSFIFYLAESPYYGPFYRPYEWTRSDTYLEIYIVRAVYLPIISMAWLSCAKWNWFGGDIGGRGDNDGRMVSYLLASYLGSSSVTKSNSTLS